MVVPVLMAIWFGYKAHRASKSVVVWALAGAAFTYTLGLVLSMVAVFLMTRSFDLSNLTIETVLATRLAVFAAIIAAFVVGHTVLKPAPPFEVTVKAPVEARPPVEQASDH